MTVWCLKITESFVILFVIKIYVFFMIYGEGVDLGMIKNMTTHLYKEYAKSFEL